MGFSWGEILSEIRYKVQEPSSGFFTDANLMAEWNQVQLNAAKKVRFIRKEIDLTFQTDGQTIILPADFLGLFSCGLTDTTGEEIIYLAQLSLHGRAQDSQMGTGYFFTTRDRIKMNAVQEDSDARMKIVYSAAPVPFADAEDTDAETNVPDDYIDVITTGVAARGQLARNKYEDYQFQWKIYLDDLAEAKRNESKRKGQIQQQIVE